jgi:chaperonin GroEL (HSP60 family)
MFINYYYFYILFFFFLFNFIGKIKIIFREGMKFVEHGVNPIEMKRGMEKGKIAVLNFLEEMKTEIN